MITKTINANGSKGHHKFALRVSEDTTSGNSSFMGYSFTLSPIQTGWDWSGWGSKISYEIKFAEDIIDEETNEITTNELFKKTGTIPSYNGNSTVTIESGSNIEIPHNSDGTKTINISFSVTDTTGQSYTCGNASDSSDMKLSVLHKVPEITSVNLVENNAKLTNLNVPNNTIVQYLSNKKITINATYDDATISNCSIYHNNVLIGTSTTNEVVVDFSKVSELITTETNGTHYVGLTIAVTDSKSGYSTRIFNFPVIKYTRPSIEATSTTIKRKTGNGTVLTDNIAILNFVGNCYKGDDVIGNANIPTVQYKIWNGTEPDYTTLTTPNTANITISDYQINNIIYTNVYNYKIKIYDIFIDTETITNYKNSKVPTGQSVFSEYKDRVDFKDLTIGNNQVMEIGGNDTDKYIKFYDGTLICIGKKTTDAITWAQDQGTWYYRNVEFNNFAHSFIEPPIVTKSIQNISVSARNIRICGNSAPTTTNAGTFNLDTYWETNGITVTATYTAIGKWK